MSPPVVVLYEDDGGVRCRTVGDAVAWASDHPRGTIYEKLGLSTAKKICEEDSAVARVVEAAKTIARKARVEPRDYAELVGAVDALAAEEHGK